MDAERPTHRVNWFLGTAVGSAEQTRDLIYGMREYAQEMLGGNAILRENVILREIGVYWVILAFGNGGSLHSRTNFCV